MRFKLLLFTLFLFSILGILAFRVPIFIGAQINTYIKENCRSCVYRIESTTFSVWKKEIAFNEIWFTSGDPEDTAVEVRIQKATIHFSFTALFDKTAILKKILIESPEVVLIEGDKKSKKEPRNSSSSGAIWKIQGTSTEILNGIFVYKRVSKQSTASIHVKNINAKVGEWKSDSVDFITEGEASGLLEHSGKFSLSVKAPIFSNQTTVEVDLKIKDLNLIDMRSFFDVSDGIQLSGSLYEGTGHVKINGNEQDAWVRAKFHGLEVHFRKTENRGALTAFFSNLIGAVKLDKSDISEEVGTQVRGVSILRLPEESLVSFIFRGMKEAALKVATETKAH